MKRILLILILMSSLFSCSSKEAKKVTDESRLAQEAFVISEAIREAYLKRDVSVIESKATKEGFREILGAMKSFDKAELIFEPKWVDIDKSKVTVKMTWKGKWVVRGQTTEERGSVVFIYDGSPLKLNRILRENPFRYPE